MAPNLPAQSPSESSPQQNLEELLEATDPKVFEAALDRLYPPSGLEQVKLSGNGIEMQGTRVKLPLSAPAA
jgi:hypothetical protein